MSQRFDKPLHIQPNIGDRQRVETLLPLVQRHLPGASRSDVWRMALKHGLDELALQHAIEGVEQAVDGWVDV